MKGITPIVAIILLLLITISMIGFAFVWFTRVSELATQQTQQQLEGQLSQTAQKIAIDAATTTSVTIRNTGSKDIPVSQISVFVDGIAKACTAPPWTGNLVVGTTITCTYTIGTCPAGVSKVKVTTPGGSDSVAC